MLYDQILTPQEQDHKARRTREFAAKAKSFKLTDRDIVILVGACFAGGCQRSDVDDLLAYISPVQQKTNLPFGTLEIDVAFVYGKTIDPSTFEAALNNVPFAGFTPSPATIEAVAVPLSPGRNTLVLQVDGQLSPGRTATDRDRLSFIVAK